MVKPVDKEDKARIDERSNAEDDGQGWEEGCDCGRDDEYFPLLPLNKFINSCKSLEFTVSTMTSTVQSLTEIDKHS